MSTWNRTVRARLRAYRTTLLGLATLTALVTAAVGGTFAFVEQSSTHSVQDAPELASGASSVLRLDTRMGPEPEEQDSQARAVIESKLSGAPVDVLRSVRSEPVTPLLGDVALARVVLVADPALPAHAGLAEGEWPGQPGEGAIRAAAAVSMGIEVGQELVVGDATVTIVGVWEPADPDSPFWAMDALVTGPAEESPFGPVLVDEATLLTFQDDPFVRWSLVPRVAELSVDDTAVMATGLGSLRGTLQASPAQERGVVETGTLGATVLRLDAEASTARSVTGVPVVVLLLVSLVSIVQVARLLVSIRGRESQILVARGVSTPQMGFLAMVEALPCAVGGAVVGAGLSWAAVTAVGPGGALTEAAWRWIVLSAAVLAVSVVATLVAVVVLDTRGLAGLRAVDSAGRTRAVVGLGGLVLLGAAAALTGWRVWLARSQAVPAAEELVVLAPGILLLTGALVALAVLAPTLRLLERWAVGARGLAPVLPARQTSRRLAGYAVPALLVALATGALLLANTYGATTSALQGQVDAVRVGTDLRVLTGARGGVTPRTTVPVVDAGASARTSLVLNADGVIGDSEVRVLAVPGGRLEAVLPATGPGAASLLAPMVGSTEEVLPGLALPEGSAALIVGVRGRAGVGPVNSDGPWATTAVSGRPVRIATTIWLADTSGGVVRVAGATALLPVDGGFAEAAATQPVTVGADVPAGGGPWRVVAIDFEVDKHEAEVTFQVEMESLTVTLASGETVPLDADADTSWVAQPALLGPSLNSWLTGELTLSVQPGPVPGIMADLVPGIAAERVRLLLAAPEVPTELSAVATPDLLERLDLKIGDTADLRIAGDQIAVRFVGEVAVVPGGLGPLALAVDLDSVHALGLSARPAPAVANEVWIAIEPGSSADDTAARVSAAAPASWSVVSTGRGPAGISGAVGTAFWLAGAGALALALAGTWSVLGAMARDRRGEVVALRSVGVTAIQQSRSRSLEIAGIIGFAIVAGLVAGVLVAGMSVELFARITVPAAPAGLAQEVVVAVVPSVVGLIALALGAAVCVGMQARTVRRQALDLDHREDAR